MSETRLHTVRSLAKHLRHLGITPRWLKDEATAGRLPHMRINRRLVFDLQAVEAALAQRAARGQAVPP